MACEICEKGFHAHPGCSYWEWQDKPGWARYVRCCRDCYQVKRPYLTGWLGGGNGIH